VAHEVENHKSNDKIVFGFWVYLMTDLLMFAVLFACFAVLRGSTFGGPPESEHYNLWFVLTETMLLLTSSFTVGLAMIAAKARDLKATLILLLITFILGASFLGMELYEFYELIIHGYGWWASASLSAFFALVATHGIHIAAGLIWMVFIVIYMLKRGLTDSSVRKLTLFSLFWHFLDIVWIFIFSIVYLMGAVIG
jgi:cytochrome o ubiquinol oxidase subunit 3